MDVTITVRVCDICKDKDKPATRYTLTGESGEAATRDLCAEDAAPVEKVFGPLKPAEKKAAPRYLNAEEETPKAPRKAPAKKAAKKATTPRRTSRTKVMTMEEIEAQKRAKAAGS
ncbi:hypothetical protein ACFYY2_07440 [Streptomyces sp. NPDC001822]|uniref:hypothetical protein n=1 Tax=Streptomyces sp. NPDC001822 TaxID=3364614 RepID=UPI0036B6BE13